MKLSHDAKGPFLLLGLDQVEAVGKWLLDRGVPYVEDPDASTSCAGPVVGVLRFPAQADVAAIEQVLERWPGPAAT